MTKEEINMGQEKEPEISKIKRLGKSKDSLVQSMKQNIHDHSQNKILDLIVEAKTNYEQTPWYMFRTKLKYKQEMKEYIEILIKREQHWKINNEI